MRKRKEFIPFLTLGIFSLISVVLTLFFVNPEKNFYGVTPVIIFFFFTFLGTSSIATYLFLNITRGLLVGFFITMLFVLQINGFANIFYITILLLIILVLDIGLKKR